MFDPSDSPRVFGLAPGADFPRALVEGVLARMADHPPEALARVEIFLNSARMLRRVRALFAEGGARLLPRLRLITDIGRDPLADLPPAVPPLRRRLELAQLVARFAATQPGFAPGTGGFALADSLARLMAEMHDEAVPPEALERLDVADFAEHWKRSLGFIRIVARYFDDGAEPDAEARQRKLVAALADRWQAAPPDHPVVIAGSTGSRGTTALFMQAVARLPQGALVLPGFDFDIPPFAWEALTRGTPAEDHPQFRFRRLLDALDLAPADVRPWGDATAPDPARNRLISLALRPAPVTDQWMTEGATLGDLAAATRGIALIEAPDARQEAVAITLALREAAETGARAALITPDRTLARRVAAALDRWRIVPDDSAGVPLQQTPAGRLLRQVSTLFGQKLAIDAVLALLKHPLTATGAADRGPHLKTTRDLELKLRARGPAFPAAEDLLAWAGAIGTPEAQAWAEWLAKVLGLLGTTGERPLSAWIDTHLAAVSLIAQGPGGDVAASELWRREGGQETRRVMEGLRAEADAAGDYSVARYGELVSSLLASGTARAQHVAHPTIAIWGTLEARVQGADLVILGGLNEGSWPVPPAPDPWLSRPMRLRAGLLLPERQIGLSAHDFQQAIAAPRVILTRAKRNAEAETVPSRWLNRLVNLLGGLQDGNGKKALDAMHDRGAPWLAQAAALEGPAPGLSPTPRPSPRPPVAMRPEELPVTAIKTLIRNPYEIYARRILRLRPLNPLRPEPDPRLRGEVLHKIVEQFLRDRPEAEDETAATARLLALAERILSEEIPWPVEQRLWLARIRRFAARFVRGEQARAAAGVPVVIEERHKIRLNSVDFTLTAQPDRIDLLSDGRVHIYDYKSGTPPSKEQIAAFDKQLLLEAGMAERGAFPTLGPREVSGMTHIHLGGDGEEKPYPAKPGEVDKTWAQLESLIAAYQRAETGYSARRAMHKDTDVSDYDHLSRLGEWDTTEPPTPEDLT